LRVCNMATDILSCGDDGLLNEPSKICYVCSQAKVLAQFHKNKAMADGHLNVCKVCDYAKKKAYRAANPGMRKAETDRLRARRGAMTRQEYFEKLRANAKGRTITVNAYAQRRRAKIESFRLSELDIFVIEEAYRLRDARRLATNFDWHVDHIVPLNHKKACGLHNAHNLQVVPAIWNLAKRHGNMNKYLGV
jgi:hypothetical protein